MTVHLHLYSRLRETEPRKGLLLLWVVGNLCFPFTLFPVFPELFYSFYKSNVTRHCTSCAVAPSIGTAGGDRNFQGTALQGDLGRAEWVRQAPRQLPRSVQTALWVNHSDLFKNTLSEPMK